MSCYDGLLDQIEIKIDFLRTELETVSTQLQHERWFFRRQQLAARKRQLEYDLRWARYQEQRLITAEKRNADQADLTRHKGTDYFMERGIYNE